MNDTSNTNAAVGQKPGMSTAGILKFLILSAIGFFSFFVNLRIGGTSAVLIQHAINWVSAACAPVLPYYALIIVLVGAAMPIVTKAYRQSLFALFFTVVKAFGAVIGIMAVFQIGPAFLMQPDYIPFLFHSIVVPITLIVPISGISFVLLTNYGLVEFIGTFMTKVMRKLFHTPGESAFDAIVSCTGGYALALIVTNSFYKKGIYTGRESVIIATGFSTVAISFMLIVANTLGFAEQWPIFFLACIFITFAVTAVTARIYPIAKIPNTYYDKPAPAPAEESGNLLTRAFRQGVHAAQNTRPFLQYVKEYYLGDATKMITAVTSSILSIGLAGILIANYTPLFDWLGYVFYPFTALLQMPEPMLAAKAAAIEIAEMFLPAMLVISSDAITRFTVGVTSITAVLFFSASIPALLSTDIPIKIKDILLIWVERTILSLILAAGVAFLVFR